MLLRVRRNIGFRPRLAAAEGAANRMKLGSESISCWWRAIEERNSTQAIFSPGTAGVPPASAEAKAEADAQTATMRKRGDS